jgi:DNA mismatch repair protein MSH2
MLFGSLFVSFLSSVARQDYVELFYLNPDLRSSVRDQFLRGSPDLQRLSAKFQKRKGCTLADVMDFFRLACVRMPQLRDALVEFAASHADYTSSAFSLAASTPIVASVGSAPDAAGAAPSPLAMPLLDRLQSELITPMTDHLTSLQPFIHMVEQAVLVDETTSHEHVRMHYSIRPDLHPTLLEIDTARKAARQALDAEVASLQEAISANSNGAIQPKLAYSDTSLNSVGFHLRLTKTELRQWHGGAGIMPGGAAAVKVLETRKDGFHFTSRKLEKLALTLQALTNDYNTASEQLLADVLATTATYTPVLDAFGALLAQLDVYSTLAHVAASANDPWVRPIILPLGGSLIDMRAARHACMEVLSTSASANFIPNDVHMERGKSHLQVITGPNMGGKCWGRGTRLLLPDGRSMTVEAVVRQMQLGRTVALMGDDGTIRHTLPGSHTIGHTRNDATASSKAAMYKIRSKNQGYSTWSVWPRTGTFAQRPDCETRRLTCWFVRFLCLCAGLATGRMSSC